MVQGRHEEGQQVPKDLQRLLAIAWIGIVLLVGACILLAVRWGMNGQNGRALSAVGTPMETLPLGAGATLFLLPTPTAMETPLSRPAEGYATPSVEPTVVPLADRSFGYGIEAQALVNPQATLDHVRQLGLGWVKVSLRWSEIEAEAGRPDWGALDAFFAEAATRNLRVLVSVSAAPAWARSVTAEGLEGPPDDPRTFAHFVAQLVQRYRGALHAVEIWEEMNQEQHWYAPGGLSAASYMELLLSAVQAVRTVDPGIIVISGGLNPTGVDDGVMAIDDFRYLQELIALGLLDYVDCVGVHLKGYNLPPDVPYDAASSSAAAHFQAPFENPHHSWSFYSTLRGYNDMIVAVRRHTPLCVTAFGWASAGGIRSEVKAGMEFALDNSPEEQARYITQAFQLMRDWRFVWLAFLFNLDFAFKADGDLGDAAALYSILAPDGSPRPAYRAVQEMPKLP